MSQPTIMPQSQPNGSEWRQSALTSYTYDDDAGEVVRSQPTHTMPPTARTRPDNRTPGDTELYIAPEVEYPMSPDSDTTFTRTGRSANEWRRRINDRGLREPVGGEAIVGTDGTVGIEIRPTQDYGLQEERVTGWYRQLLEEGRAEGYPHEPVGEMGDGHSTAGLHMHLSPFTEEQAQTLYEWSQEDWMQAFACSTIVGHEDDGLDASVFRGGRYCKFNGFNNSRYSAVHDAPGPGHYEWRLPEPMTPDHFDLLVEFLTTFYYEGDTAAKQFARGLVRDRDERLTAVRRFNESELDAVIAEPTMSVHRSPWTDSVDFYDRIRQDASMPYIFQVYDHDNEAAYYTFRSYQNDDDESFHDSETDLQITSGTVLDASSLTPASPEQVEAANEALREHRTISAGHVETSSVTELLMQ